MSVGEIAELERRIRRLEEQGVPAKELADLVKCCEQVEKWIKQQVKWSNEVTDMLRAVNWAKLVVAYPGGGGGNPPQDPPTWPPS